MDGITAKTAAIYLRSAADGPDGLKALSDQLRTCRALAATPGQRVDDGSVYREVGSGLAPFRDRSQMRRLRVAVEAGDMAAVIAATPDRIARDSRLVVEFLAWAEEAGGGVEFADGSPTRAPAWNL